MKTFAFYNSLVPNVTADYFEITLDGVVLVEARVSGLSVAEEMAKLSSNKPEFVWPEEVGDHRELQAAIFRAKRFEE